MKLKYWLVIVAVAGLVVTQWNVQSAPARNQYEKAFKAAYPDLETALKEVKCSLCHGVNAEGKKDNKIRNHYGEAYGKTLGKKNVKDEMVLKEGLKKIEGEKSAVEGKTFGDLIQDKKLPSAK